MAIFNGDSYTTKQKVFDHLGFRTLDRRAPKLNEGIFHVDEDE